MSRWIEYFENHAFHQAWNSIMGESKNLNVDSTTPTDVQELARLKKVVKYIDELLNACDPEIIPIGVWDNFSGQSNECLAQINLFNQNKNIGHLQNSNANLDNLLTYIRPYMLSSSSAAQAAGKAFKAYSDTVVKEMNNFKERVQNDVINIKSTLEESEKIYSSIKIAKTQIEEFNTRLFVDNEGEESFKTKAEKLLKEVTEWHAKVKSYYEILLVDVGEQISLRRQTDGAVKNILSGNDSVDKTLEDIESKLTDFRKFYLEVFGTKNEETEKLEGGLKQELELGKQKYKALLTEIESLIPGATSAGLASAYGELKNSFDEPIKNNTRIFYAALVAIITTSLIAIIEKIGWFSIEFVDVSNHEKLLNSFLFKLPLVIPVVWLAFFSSKRRSEAQRLQQEYAHKEAITKSYQSFKKQIEDLGEKNGELMKNLLDTAILAVAYNASKTLDKKHGDKMPVQEVAESIVGKISSLGQSQKR